MIILGHSPHLLPSSSWKLTGCFLFTEAAKYQRLCARCTGTNSPIALILWSLQMAVEVPKVRKWILSYDSAHLWTTFVRFFCLYTKQQFLPGVLWLIYLLLWCKAVLLDSNKHIASGVQKLSLWELKRLWMAEKSAEEVATAQKHIISKTIDC